jgi:hypothetical protein
VVQISRKLNKILDLLHLFYQSRFFVEFFEFFHLKIELNNFFIFIFFSFVNYINYENSLCTCDPNFKAIEKILDLIHVCYESGFFANFFAFFHLK